MSFMHRLLVLFRFPLGCVLVLGFCLLDQTARAEVVRGEHGVAATGHPLATDAAIQAMRHGGNAIDAAVAAALTLGVVDGHNSGLGGGCFLLIRLADGRVVAIDGRETAPAAATRDLFVREGKAVAELSQTGALAPGVPGALKAYDYALRHFGRRPLKEHLRAAAQFADDGFVLDRGYAQRLAANATNLARFPETRAIFLDANGQPFPLGARLRQPDLARTYRNLARHGVAWFYDGPFARATETWMRAHGGLLTARDFAQYKAKLREPLVTTYRGYELLGFPPPSSGGVHVAQILNLVEPFDLKALGAGSADEIHVVTEAMKLAFADRAHWLGDPDFAP